MLSGLVLSLFNGVLLGVLGLPLGGILGALAAPAIAVGIAFGFAGPIILWPFSFGLGWLLTAFPVAAVGALVVGLLGGLVGAIVTPAGLSQLHILSFFHQGFAGLVSF